LRISHGANPGDNEVVSISQNGNVGIGSTTPQAKLEVNGQVKMTGGSPGAGKVLTSDADGLASWSTSPGDSDWTMSGNDMYSGVSGNVGIGTPSPSQRLEVDGGITAFRTGQSGLIQINDKRPTGGAWNLYADEGDFHINESGAINAERLRIEAGGEVGIGTPVPQSKLSVGGPGYADTGVYGQGANTGVVGEGGVVGVTGKSSPTGVEGIGTTRGGSFSSTAGDGVYGDSQTGKGVYGSSESGEGVRGENRNTDNHGMLGGGWYGVYGRYGTSGPSGVLGGDTYGVKGSSAVGDGVFGESTAADKSGVYGHGTNGPGVAGRSASSDHSGVFGITSAADGIGVRGSSATAFGDLGGGLFGVRGAYGSDPETATTVGVLGAYNAAVHANGDLVVVNGAFRGSVQPDDGAPYPRPAFESAWETIPADSLGFTWQHDISQGNPGVDAFDYVVELMTRESGGGAPGNRGVGTHMTYTVGLDIITVYREADTMPDQARVRIWVIK
jgi:hypothetical protein